MASTGNVCSSRQENNEKIWDYFCSCSVNSLFPSLYSENLVYLTEFKKFEKFIFLYNLYINIKLHKVARMYI